MCDVLEFGFPRILGEHISRREIRTTSFDDFLQEPPSERFPLAVGGPTTLRGGDHEPRGIIKPGPVKMPSAGSIGHDKGACRPCAWEPKPGGCSKGSTCEFCHLCEEGEVKRRKKERLVALRASRAKKKQGSMQQDSTHQLPITALAPIAHQRAGFVPVLSKEETTVPNLYKEKDGGEDAASTAASSEVEDRPGLATSVIIDFPVPQDPVPVVLCRAANGTLYMSPACEGVDHKVVKPEHNAVGHHREHLHGRSPR